MKQFLYISIIVGICLALIATVGMMTSLPSVRADATSDGYGLAIENLDVLTADNMRKSNPDANDRNYHAVYGTDEFTLRNKGIQTISGITLQTGLDKTKYNISVAESSSGPFVALENYQLASLAAGASKTLYLKARIPEDLNAVDPDTLKEAPISVGQLEARGTLLGQQTTTSVTVQMQTRNKLEIKHVRVVYNGDSSQSLSDGDEIKKIKPGTKLVFTIEVENNFKNNDREDISIQNNNVEVNFDDSDIDSQDDDPSDLSAGDTDEITITTDVPDDIRSGSSSFTIELRGEDDFGGQHGQKYNLDLSVDRQTHALSITKMDFNPTSVSCDRTATLSVAVQNVGKNDEDNSFVIVDSSALKFYKKTLPTPINENDNHIFTFSIPVPATLKAGTYEAYIYAYYSESKDSTDNQRATITVTDCKPEGNGGITNNTTNNNQNTNQQQNNTQVIVTPASSGTQVPPTYVPATTTRNTAPGQEVPFTDSSLYMVLLIGTDLIILIVTVVLVSKLFSRR
ncbi:hypothetical protein HZB02_05645 [Candidatus Woesearchaeota archaeon]|nr:hypothetical protein [Candidatus Woesearchaeota archaeon]